MSKRSNIAYKVQELRESYERLVQTSYAMVTVIKTGGTLESPCFLEIERFGEEYGPLYNKYNKTLYAACFLYEKYSKGAMDEVYLFIGLLDKLLSEYQAYVSEMGEGVSSLKAVSSLEDVGMSRTFSEVYGSSAGVVSSSVVSIARDLVGVPQVDDLEVIWISISIKMFPINDK